MKRAHPDEIQALRVSRDRAVELHLAAHYRLVVSVSAAIAGRGEWPSAADYDMVAMLGRATSAAQRKFLDGVGVIARPVRTALERKELIQRLAASERLWQPTPEDWLKQQGFGTGETA